MKNLLLLCYFLRVFVPAHSQEKRILGFTYYSTEQGLGSSNVHKIKVDKYGFAWIATQDGLYRFDGTRFITYNKTENKKHRIAGADLKDFLFQGDTMWVISSYGGINGIDLITGNVFYELDQESQKELANVLFNSLAISGNRLFVGSDKGLYTFNTSSYTISKNKLPANIDTNQRIHRILLKNNNLWIFLPTLGIMVYDVDQGTPIDFFKTGISYYYDCDISDSFIVTATNSGLYKFRLVNNKIQKLLFGPDIPSQIIGTIAFSVAVEKNNSIWFSTNQFVYKIDSSGKNYEIIKPGKVAQLKDWTMSVFGIFLDTKNNVWLSTQQGAAFASRESSAFIAYQQSATTNSLIKHAYGIYPDTDSTIYVCSEDGLYLVNLTTSVISAIDQGRIYFFAFENFDRNLVVSNEQNTYLKKGATLIPFQQYYTEFRAYEPLLFNSFIQLSDTCIILGSQNERGIFNWNPKKHSVQNITINSSLLRIPDNDVNTLFKLNDSSCLILAANSISLYQPSRNLCREIIINNPVDKKKYSLFFDITRIGDLFFLSSYGHGIIVLDANFNLVRLLSTNEGLANNGVYKMFAYQDSMLLATTNNGLSKINTRSWVIRNYYNKDGIHSNVFEELSGGMRNKVVYAGGADGLTAIHLDRLTQNSIAPDILFTNVVVTTNKDIQDTSNIKLDILRISNKAKQTTIYFTSLNYTNPENTKYFYRIPEIQQQWIPNHNQNFITLIGLSPGKYHLQIKAINADSIEGEYSELTLVFLPKWYQTWWFKTLIALSIVAIGYGIYRLRINQLKKEEKIRNQLASDLHDDLGSTLNSVKVYSNLAMMEKENPQHLLRIKESTQEAIAGVRDLIWVLDDKKDTVRDLLARINQFAAPLCEANHIQYTQYTADSFIDYKLGKGEKRNLYMIAKESVNNSIKYANCQAIELKVTGEGKKIQFTIRDNGKGFDKEKIKAGNGLKNITARAKEIGYASSIIATEGNGTIIELKKE